MILQSGREIPDDECEPLLDEIIESIITMYVSFNFEDFDNAVDITAQSLQKDKGWLPDQNAFTYEEAIEIVDTVKNAAHKFANELAQAYDKLYEAYIGTRSWELYR